MYMKPGEICKEYNLAKDKKAQISILADQNCCEKEDIIKILLENGIKPPAQKKPTAKPKEAEAVEVKPKEEKAQDEPQTKQQSMPEAVAGALIARLEELEAEIVAKDPQKREISLDATGLHMDCLEYQREVYMYSPARNKVHISLNLQRRCRDENDHSAGL